MKLRIEGEGLTSRGYKVFLDDQDVTNSLRSLTLSMSPSYLNEAEIVLAPDEITVSAEALASLISIGEATVDPTRAENVGDREYDRRAELRSLVTPEIAADLEAMCSPRERPDPSLPEKVARRRRWRR